MQRAFRIANIEATLKEVCDGELAANYVLGRNEYADRAKGRETFRADGRQLYIVYPDGAGTSKFSHAVIEKKLGMRGTARNWNTVLKLA